MTLKIEVGDKVRIAAVEKHWDRYFGDVGEVGTVDCFHSEGRSAWVVGVGVGDDGWSHPVANLALFADELEDMPADTVVTFKGYKGHMKRLSAKSAVRRFRGTK